MLCFTYAHLFALPVICLRFFTVYGPRQRPALAINKFTALMEAGKPIPIFGDGSTGRGYTYIDDIVAGVLAALERVPQPTMARLSKSSTLAILTRSNWRSWWNFLSA
jgi:UDP-glucuronate 4-epimerase